ncbi:hypothetical protein ABPG72_013655 [Tetrahymena utriculariae]
MSNQTFNNQSSLETSFQNEAKKRSQQTLNVQEPKINTDDQIYSSQSFQTNANTKQKNCLYFSNLKSSQPVNVISDNYDSKKQENFAQEQTQDNTIDDSYQFHTNKQERQSQIYQQVDISEQQKIILTQIEKKEETTVENDECTYIYSKKFIFSNYYEGYSVYAGKCLFERFGIQGKY